MDFFVYESIMLRKGEQNDVAREFFTFIGEGFGISKKYLCKLCEEIVTAGSPRLAALSHRHEHPEIEIAFREAGLYEVWRAD